MRHARTLGVCFLRENCLRGQFAWLAVDAHDLDTLLTKAVSVIQQYGEVYTITDVAFTNTKTKQLANRVLVPSHFFKAVYIPATDQAGVYYAPNDESERIDVISVDELTAEIGIDVLPMLDTQTKSEAFDLPLKAGEASEGADTSAQEPDWMLFVWAILEWLLAQLKA